MFRLFVFAAFLVLLFVDSFAQTKNVSGRVVNEEQQPVEDASVYILNTNSTLFTNKEGSFTITNVKEGNSICLCPHKPKCIAVIQIGADTDL